MINRRELLVGSATAAAGASLGPAALVAAGEALDRAAFEPLLGTRVTVYDSGTWTVHYQDLVEVIDGPYDPAVEQFVLLLRDRHGVEHAEGTYWLWFAWIGLHPLHIAPAGRDAEGRCYHVASFALLR